MKTIILVSIILINLLKAQTSEAFDEKQFFQELKNSYYNLNDTNLKNLTALITNVTTENFANEQWNNKEIFPLQLIWFRPDKLYLAQQGVPTITEDNSKKYQDIVEELKERVKGILVDFDRFYISGIYKSIKSQYKLTYNEDVVWINFYFEEDNEKIPVKYTMGRNGLCLKIDVYYPNQDKIITFNPKFKILKTKWICTGWQVQTSVKDKPISGYILDIRYDQYQSIWIPTQILINWQKVDEPGTTYYDLIKFRSYMFNQPIELQESVTPNQ